MFLGQRFVGGTQVNTDASLLNRFVEWRYVIDAIKDSPITGYGLGSKYHSYNWLTGFAIDYEYTHNGYLAVVLKAGIVGAILLAIPALGYFLRAIRLFSGTLLTSTERAYLRAGIVVMVFIAISGITANTLFQRELSLYIALFWCFCMHLEWTTQSRQNLQNQSPFEPS
jgi:O-antigen ligase